MITCDRAQPRNYESDGVRYYGVTTICHVMTGAQPYGDQVAMDRGTDLHTIFSLQVGARAGRCRPPLVPTMYAGYYRSMQLGLDWLKVEPVLIERPSVSSVKGLPFAGTPDLLAWVSYMGKKVLAVIDLKTGQKERWHAAQVMAYGKLTLYREADILGLLYINPDGELPTFDLVKPNPRTWAAFQSALNLLLWREA